MKLALALLLAAALTGAAQTVTVTAPPADSTNSGVITTAATASGTGLQRVDLLLDGAPLNGTNATAAFTLTWDTTTVSNGTHSIVARAYTSSGVTALSTPVSITVSNAIAPTWAKRFGNTGTDEGLAVATDSSRNVYMCGYYNGAVNFGGGSRANAGMADIVLVKHTPEGLYAWDKTVGSSDDDRATALTVDSNGDLLMVGYFHGTVSFGGAPLTSAGGRDLFIAKYSSAGTHLWSKRIGSPGDEIAYAVATDAANAVIVTGFFQGTTDFGTGPISSTYGGLDTFVAKYDSSGLPVWSKHFTNNSDDIGYGIAVDSAGNIIISGAFMGKINFGTGVLTSAGFYDAYVVKMTTAGATLWAQRFGSTFDDIAYSVAVDSSNNVLATGFFNGTVDFGAGPLVASGTDGFLLKFSASGATTWSQKFGGISSDTGKHVAADSTGNVILAGSFSNTATFGTTTVTSAGAAESFVAKYSPSGAVTFVRKGGGTSNDIGDGVAADNQGYIISSGYFQGTAVFGGTTLTSSATYDSDIFLMRTSP